jgi:DNA primase large subunit
LQDEATWRKDQVSHHVLRLAFRSSEEQRRWFLTQEALLFRARLATLNAQQTE